MSAEKPLPPFIDDQLHFLLSHSPLPLKVDQIWAGCKNSRCSDHFTLSIPFCVDFFKLPSGDLTDEDFNPLLEIANGGESGGERKSSLRDWNTNDPSKLLALVHEIRDLYLEYHRKRVGKLDDERLKFETVSVFSRKVHFSIPTQFPRLQPVLTIAKLSAVQFSRCNYCVTS